jgi:hypothetical protein
MNRDRDSDLRNRRPALVIAGDFLYAGKQTAGEEEQDPLLASVYHELKPHAHALRRMAVAREAGPAYDLKGPIGC